MPKKDENRTPPQSNAREHARATHPELSRGPTEAEKRIEDERQKRKDFEHEKSRIAKLIIDIAIKKELSYGIAVRDIESDIERLKLFRKSFLEYNNYLLKDELLKFLNSLDADQLDRAFAAAKSAVENHSNASRISWKDRKLYEETASLNSAEFLAEVYKEEIKSGLKRADLLDLDKPLYKAYTAYISDNGVPKNLESLERSPITREELEELGINRPKDAFDMFPDDRKKAQRYASAASTLLSNRSPN